MDVKVLGEFRTGEMVRCKDQRGYNYCLKRLKVGWEEENETGINSNLFKSLQARQTTLNQHIRSERARRWLLAKQDVRVACGQAALTCYGNMDLMFANMVSSGLCVAIHQPQTHLCNRGGNLSEERWAEESPPHCLAGPDEISKHTAVLESTPTSPQQTWELGSRKSQGMVIIYMWNKVICLRLI